MLKKLIKNEMIATWRIFLPIYIGLLIATGIATAFARIATRVDTEVMSILLGTGTIILILGLMFVLLSPFIVLAVRFYKTTATREAYLTFTLPVKVNTILLSKLIVSFFWLVATFLLWYLCFGFILFQYDTDLTLFDFVHEMIDNHSFTAFCELLTLIIGFATSILTIYAAISLSQLVRSHRVLASIAFYIGIYTIQQFLALFALISYFVAISDSSFLEQLTMYGAMDSSFQGLYLLSSGFSAAFGIACYFISNYILSKKLDLL